MSETKSSLLPFPSFAPYPDRDSEPYWAALAEGDFRLQACQPCGALRWPPRAICNRCSSFEADWRSVPQRGSIVSWTRTHQAFAPNCKDAVPYYVVQVALDAQPDLLLIGGWLEDREPVSDEHVAMTILEAEGGFHLPCWSADESD